MLLGDGGANNIFSELTRAQFRDARQTIVQAILSTDMSSHMQHCADVFQLAQKAKRVKAGEKGGGGERALGRGSHRGAGGRGGARDRITFVSPLPSRETIIAINKAEDRSFLTKTIVHWCVCVCVLLRRGAPSIVDSTGVCVGVPSHVFYFASHLQRLQWLCDVLYERTCCSVFYMSVRGFSAVRYTFDRFCSPRVSMHPKRRVNSRLVLHCSQRWRLARSIQTCR